MESPMGQPELSRQELLTAIAELNERLNELESQRGERRSLETALRGRTHDLNERMKELECIHALLQAGLKADDPFERGAEKILAIIREGWQHSDAAVVRIRWDSREYRSVDFDAVRARQIEPISVQGKRRGEVEVGYIADKPSVWQGPFLKEEAKLLRSIALWLSLVIDKIDNARPGPAA